MMFRTAALTVTLMLTATARADLVSSHPAGPQLATVLKNCATAAITPTGVTKADYLKLIAGNVDFFKTCQNEAGAIIDPVSKGERQYSTPAFAVAAGLLAAEAGRDDLRDPATRALTCALTALVEKRAADNHADFYAPMVVHAYRLLRPLSTPEQVAAWEALFRRIIPESTYRPDMYHGNWNIVASSGEFLRRKENLVAPEARDGQLAWLTARFTQHLPQFTPFGMYVDPNAPLAYDAFPRLWIEDALADGAFDAKLAETYEPTLRTAGLTTLLLLSPTGEWASGGRSALHNWNDLQVAAICEMNANYWKANQNAELAGCFKRAAHLAFQSAARWRRPTGELNIVKNRAEPAKRHGYEAYSHHSQYNLLPMAMLAIACERADDSIVERATPSEVGGYVLDLRETFHKIVAAAGGYYVLIDTSADPHYNATGLQRVHRAGVPSPTLNDSAAADRSYGPKGSPKTALTPGIVWRESDVEVSLANFVLANPKAPAVRTVKRVDLSEVNPAAARTIFTVQYTLAAAGESDRLLTERYTLTAAGVSQQITIDHPAIALQLPVLTHDGADAVPVKLANDSIAMTVGGSITIMTAANTAGPFMLSEAKIPTHAGFVQAGRAPVASSTVTLTYTLSQAK